MLASVLHAASPERKPRASLKQSAFHTKRAKRWQMRQRARRSASAWSKNLSTRAPRAAAPWRPSPAASARSRSKTRSHCATPGIRTAACASRKRWRTTRAARSPTRRSPCRADTVSTASWFRTPGPDPHRLTPRRVQIRLARLRGAARGQRGGRPRGVLPARAHEMLAVPVPGKSRRD